jgi:pimeloyl-ACP methyl ester carboxylesterase
MAASSGSATGERALVTVLVAAALVVGCAPHDERVGRETTVTPGNYAAVNGLKMYYEIHGTGRPLVLLHGGLTTIQGSFEKVLPSFANTRRVIAVEQQGHGRTADVDRPLSFGQMADDTAELLRQLGIQQADFFGYSDGGNVALGIAIRHPELVRKFVIAGTNYNNDGLYPEILEFFKDVKAEDLGPELRDAYTDVAPHPEDWPTLVAKVMKQAAEFEGWQPEDIRAIGAPALIMIGDADIVRPEHAVELFRLLPHAQLAVLPGTEHQAIVERAEWLLSMISAFFEAPMPEPRNRREDAATRE